MTATTHPLLADDGLAAQARTLIEQSLFGICIVQGGMIRFANQGAALMFAFDHPALMCENVALLELVAVDDRERVGKLLQQYGEGRAHDLRCTFAGRRCDGSGLWVVARGRTVEFAGRPAILFLLLDLSDQQRSEAERERLAASDSLTGLPNRILLFDRLQQSIIQSQRSDELFALLCIDLDRFREINVRCGQSGGDQMLRIVAGRLTGVLRASDTLARTGGDQFAVIARGLLFGDDVQLVVDKLHQALATPIGFAGSEFRLTVSIGIALFPAAASDANSLFRAAETAMQASKLQGPGGYRIASAAEGVAGEEGVS